MQTKDIETKDYEMGFLATDETGSRAVLEALKRRGAEILVEGPVERIPLAYKIRRETSAYFGYVQFRVLPGTVSTLRDDVKGNKSILRLLIVTPPLEKPKPRWEGAKTRLKVAAAPQSEIPTGPLPLSNEALEKKIEEILQ